MNHSTVGLLKSIELSTKSFFVFVEGKDVDPVYYERAIGALEVKHDVEIIIPSSKSRDYGGKQTLIDLWKILKTNYGTRYSFKGKRKAIIFALDKDIDDINGELIDDDSVIYTKGYCVENDLYKWGNIDLCFSNITSIPLYDVKKFNIRDLVQKIVARNIDYIAMTIACHMLKIRDRFTYGASPNGAPDPRTEFDRLGKMANIDRDSVRLEFEKWRSLALNYIITDEIDSVVKGKWYWDMI